MLVLLLLAAAPPAAASTIVYTCGPDICSVEPDGSKQRRLTRATTDPPRFHDDAQLFPSGRRMVFEYDHELFIADARAKNRRRVAVPDGGTIGQTVLRSDSRELLFANGLGREFRRLCRVGVAAGAKPRCGSIAPGNTGYFAWGPGGAILSTQTDERHDICSTSLNGICKRVLVRIKDPKTFYLRPATSPDGRLIAAAVDQGTEHGGLRIALFDARTGKHVRDATRNAGDFLPAWSADGRRIVFQRGGSVGGVVGERGSICWVAREGGKVRCPVRDEEDAWLPSWGG
jgi:hypothetical protein